MKEGSTIEKKDGTLSEYSRDQTFTIPNGVTEIVEGRFRNQKKLVSVTIPPSVIKIKDLAFYECNRLVSALIPKSVTTIGYCAITQPFFCKFESEISIVL